MKIGRGLIVRSLLAVGLICVLTPLATGQGRARRPGKKAGRQSILRPTPRSRPKIQRPAANRGNRPDAIEQLLRMNSAQRRHFFENNQGFKRMPLARQREVHRRIAEFDALPERQKQFRLERYQLFRDLRADKQTQARRVYQFWGRLPAPRRHLLMKDVEALRGMNDDERRSYAVENGLATKYSQQELRVMRELVALKSAPTDAHVDAPDGP